MNILVTGGSGYIGAHTVHALMDRGDRVVIIDDLMTGFESRVPDVPVVVADLSRDESREVICGVLLDYQVDAVIHFAARKQVAESVARPAWYYQQNIGGLANLLLAMEDANVARIVFSSSAAVYGDVDGAVDEAHPTTPINSYGATKLAGEQLLAAASVAWGVQAISLRYFNVGGAGRNELGDTNGDNLIPMVFDRISRGIQPEIFGDDYSTPDGTCIRDYVHVVDVAEAHLAALDRLPDTPGHTALNIGTGVGTSVHQMISRILEVAASDLTPAIRERRQGDPEAVVAEVDRAREIIGWSARLGIADIVESSWSSREFFDARTE